MRFKPHTAFPVLLLRPLGHLSRERTYAPFEEAANCEFFQRLATVTISITRSTDPDPSDAEKAIGSTSMPSIGSFDLIPAIVAPLLAKSLDTGRALVRGSCVNAVDRHVDPVAEHRPAKAV